MSGHAARVDEAMAAWAPVLPLAVAYSAGADSTALLHACARRWPGEVCAIHVHHGLQTAADGFEALARRVCGQLHVPLAVRRVDARAAPGESPEEAARDARYEAILAVTRTEFGSGAIKTVALAQHVDDQAETLLLVLSRGAGLPGLAGMGAQRMREGLAFERPWLALAKADIHAWLAREDLREGRDWLQDPSNADRRFTRNRIRHEVMPALERALPGASRQLARSAAHMAQAQRLLDTLADMDLQATGCPPALAALQALDRDRQANVLRRWLRVAHGAAASTAQLGELLDQIDACRTRGHDIALRVGMGRVARRGPVIDWYNP